MTTILATAVPLVALFVQTDPAGYNHPEFVCYIDESERFLALLRRGNSPDRTGRIVGPERRPYLTVFEYLGEGKSLRKLYELELLNNRGEPLFCMLSCDGRFFLTLDEWNTAGVGPFTVVIYDLARKEHSAYAGKDFLGEKLMKSLPIRGFVPGIKWFGLDLVFSEDNTKFYPTLPSNCEEEGVPFVVIDLPTRTVSVQPRPEADPKNTVPRIDHGWSWRESKKTVETKTTILPARMARIKWSSPGLPDRVLELSQDKTEYVPVDSAANSKNQNGLQGRR